VKIKHRLLPGSARPASPRGGAGAGGSGASDAAVCESTRFLLEAFGFEVSTYSNGADFTREDPEVASLIVDYWMPGLNGLEFVLELKTRGRQVPTIMITAMVDRAMERRAAELGIKHVLHKPPSPGELLRALREELSRSAWPRPAELMQIN
jgi:two-component system, LuxR family, response regulator FixJ